jgi:hypothetical protein
VWLNEQILCTLLLAGGVDRNYTAMHTHVWWSVHLSALLITWVTSRRWIATKIHLWCCLLHCSSPSHSW